MSTLWTGARQSNATFAAKLAALDYLDAAPRTLQGSAPSFSHFLFSIGAYLTGTEDFAWALVGDTSACLVGHRISTPPLSRGAGLEGASCQSQPQPYALVVMLLSESRPPPPVPSIEPLGLRNSPKLFKIGVFVAPSVYTVHMTSAAPRISSALLNLN